MIDISTYKYENSLRLLILNLKNTKRPLEQVARRLIEKQTLENEQNWEKVNEYLNPKQQTVEVFNGIQHKNQFVYTKIKLTSNAMLSSKNVDGTSSAHAKNNDCWFLTKSNEIFRMLFVCKNGTDPKFIIHGLRIKEKRSFFKHPIDSTKLNIYECSILDLKCNALVFERP